MSWLLFKAMTVGDIWLPVGIYFKLLCGFICDSFCSRFQALDQTEG